MCGAEFSVSKKSSKKQSCSRHCGQVLSWRDPVAREKRCAAISEVKRTPEGQESVRRANRERWSRPGERAKLSERNRRAWADPVERGRMTEAIRRVQSAPEQRRLYSDMRRRMWAADPAYRAKTVAGIHRSKRTPEARALFSRLMSERWRDPVVGPKYLAAVRRLSDETRGKRRARPVVHVPIDQFTKDEVRALSTRRWRIKAAAKRFDKEKPVTGVKELTAVAARSKVKIKRYPAGAHTGWRPSWMGE